MKLCENINDLFTLEPYIGPREAKTKVDHL